MRRRFFTVLLGVRPVSVVNAENEEASIALALRLIEPIWGGGGPRLSARASTDDERSLFEQRAKQVHGEVSLAGIVLASAG